MHPHPILHHQEPLVCDLNPFQVSIQTYHHLVGFLFRSYSDSINKYPWRISYCREVLTTFLSRTQSGNHTLYTNDPIAAVVLSRSHYENRTYEQIKWNIARFLWYVEGHHSLEQRSRVHPTPNEQVINIHPSPFWLTNYQLISLFTLIIRAGGFCDEGKSMDAMMNYDYFTTTKDAFKKFLDGHTHVACNKPFGWRALFAGGQGNRRLIKKEEVARKAEELWSRAGRPHGQENEFWLRSCEWFDNHFSSGL